MKCLSKILGFCIILFCFTNKSIGYVSPIPPESVDTLEAMMANMFQEPPRDPLPSMDLNQIILDIVFEGMEYFEQNYSQEVVDIIKPAWESFTSRQPYGYYEDEQGEIYITHGSKDEEPRYYLQDILDYGDVRLPVLIYSIINKSGDRYEVPLAYKDTIKAYVHFEPDSFELTSMSYTDIGPESYFFGLTEYPPIDSVEADSIVQDALQPGEEIVSQRLFNIVFSGIPYWGFLTQTESKSTPDTNIHWIDPINKEPH